MLIIFQLQNEAVSTSVDYNFDDILMKTSNPRKLKWTKAFVSSSEISYSRLVLIIV